MFKRVFFHGLVAGVLAAIAAIIYNRIYFFATEADFSKILNTASMIGLSLVICMIATFVNYSLVKWLRQKGEIVFNFLFSIISFACVMFPISISLPLDIKMPELFPGLAVPMVFFPVIAWLTIKPLFQAKEH
jgi:membrane protease YdiL (CAAX protease family)